MRNNIWIINHYATKMYIERDGRHYWIAKHLNKLGYKPVIICASTVHNSSEEIEIGLDGIELREMDGLQFVFIKTPKYTGNGIKRILNMFSFYHTLLMKRKLITERLCKPDIIYASSVHPLTLVAGIKLARKFLIPCISEVRDLWPESLVAYGVIKKKSILTSLLYQGEKWIYQNSNAVIMTWEGGRQYILDKKWDKKISLEKIHYISNGVCLDSFYEKCKHESIVDNDLDTKNYLKIVYAGSIRNVNNLGIIVDLASVVQERLPFVRFLIYGDGDEREQLEQRCCNDKISNIIFKGKINKYQVPYVLSKADINILHNTSTVLDKYGQSQNKLFEYLAAGKPILQTYSSNYSVIENNRCGVCSQTQTVDSILDALISICKDKKNLEDMGHNSSRVAMGFEYKLLTNKISNIINNLLEELS